MVSYLRCSLTTHDCQIYNNHYLTQFVRKLCFVLEKTISLNTTKNIKILKAEFTELT